MGNKLPSPLKVEIITVQLPVDLYSKNKAILNNLQ